jgi:transposase-like protein
MEVAVPRDREGVFEPQLVPKHQKEFRGFDDKILSMYALGLTTRQIQDHLKEIYAVEVSPELISRATDEVKELAAEWRAVRWNRSIRCCFWTPCGSASGTEGR